jgi:F420-non-reducing hydrogenase small subunit
MQHREEAAEVAKPKLAFYWCGSCGGCEESVVDLAEGLLGVLDAAEIVLWPVALDFKRKDVEALADGAIAAAFINGSVRLSEHEEWAHLLRAKARVLVAHGSCAHTGGVPSLANFHRREEILSWTYVRAPSLEPGNRIAPAAFCRDRGRDLHLPTLWDTVKSLDQIVEVDYYLPGCPPPPGLILSAAQKILSGDLPPKGSVLAPPLALCEDCPRRDTKPERLELSGFRRLATATPDPAVCLLAQGFVCLGPATRTGCGAVCIAGNAPCSGCFGPPAGVADQGAALISALATLVEGEDERDLGNIAQSIPDPAGTFYRYGLAASTLHRSAGGSEP